MIPGFEIRTAVFVGVASPAAQFDLWEITPADERSVIILGLTLVQTTDLGDAEEETLPWRIIRGHTTSGSGGAAVTPETPAGNAGAVGATLERMNTTIASAGTTDDIFLSGWNIRDAGEIWLPPDIIQNQIKQANTTGVIRVEAPADAITISSCLTYAENTP